MPLAKMLFCIHAVVGLILGVIATIGSLTNAGDDGFWALGAWSLLVFPVVNSAIGFLTGIFIAWIYNLFAQLMGGIELEFEGQENELKLSI